MGAFLVAGMFFEMFFFLTLVIVGLLVYSAGWRKLWPLIICSVFLVLTGGVLMSDGVRYECGSTFVQASGVTTYDYCTLTTVNDFTTLAFANTYFYGGFIVAVFALGYFLKGRSNDGK